MRNYLIEEPRLLPFWFVVAVGFLVCLGETDAAHSQSLPARASFPDMSEAAWMDLARLTTWEPQNSAVLRIINRLPNISDANWKQYLEANRLTLDEILAAPSSYVGAACRLSGTARRFSKVDLPAELAGRFNSASYYLVEVELIDDGVAIVVVQSIPSAWLSETQLSEPVECRAIYLMTGSKNGTPRPALATDRLKWFPNSENPRKGIGPSQLLLAKNGFDLGLFDQVRDRTNRAFISEEQRLVGEFLTAVDRVDENSAAEVDYEWDLFDAIRKPERFRGSLLNISGTVRRVTPVYIESPRLREQLGFDHYFQLDVFLSLGRWRSVHLDPEQQVTIKGKFGVNVLLSRLPEELRDGRDDNPQIEVPCFFLKHWQHPTAASRDVSAEIRKLTPILVGLPNRLSLVQRQSDASASWFAASFFGFLLIAVIGLLWWTGARERNSARRQSKLRGALLDPQIGRIIESENQPDQESTAHDSPTSSGPHP